MKENSDLLTTFYSSLREEIKTEDFIQGIFNSPRMAKDLKRTKQKPGLRVMRTDLKSVPIPLIRHFYLPKISKLLMCDFFLFTAFTAGRPMFSPPPHLQWGI